MKKRILALCLIATLLLNLAGCSNKTEKIRICLDWTPNTNHTGLFVAEEKGFFAEEGLEVEIMDAPEGGATTLVGAGGAELGVDFQDYLAKCFASDAPVPVTAVAALIQHNTSGVVSLKSKGIDSPRKLEGVNYATWEEPSELKILEKMMRDDGGDFKKVNLIPNTVTDVVQALRTNVDAVWIYKAWDGIALDVAGVKTNMLYFRDYGDEYDYYSPVLVANDDFLKHSPDTAKKVLRAIRRGYEYAIENVDDAVNIFMEKAPENDKNQIQKSQEWLKNQYKAEVSQWGYIDPARWDRFYSWAYDSGIIEKQIPAGFGFSNEYLN